MTMTANEKLATKLLRGAIIYEIAGWENEVTDGYITKEEFFDRLDIDRLKQIANYSLKEAARVGYLESEYSAYTMEVRHLNFLGKERLEYIKTRAAELARKRTLKEWGQIA